MKWTDLLPLLVYHAIPGLLGGVLRWLYLLRTDRYKSQRPWLKMLYDILGGLLVGTVLAPALASFATIPPEPFSLAFLRTLLRTLPFWLVSRWFVSAVAGCFWLAVLDESKKRITKLVREWNQRSGKGGNNASKNTLPRRSNKSNSR